jgi:hypothetical protein
MLMVRLFLIMVFTCLGMMMNVNAQTKSSKRGVAGDMLDVNDCNNVSNYLTWFYNWANTPNAGVTNISQSYIEYCPMLWNGTWNAANLNTYLTAHPEVKYLLTFNEPNLTSQSNMTPAQAAALWPQVEAIASTYNLKIVSPAMTYCPSGCIAGYTGSGIPWLDAFFAACPGCKVDYIALHIYDTWLYGFEGNVGNNVTGYKKYGKPIWITEFAQQGLNSSSVAQHADLMVDAVGYMEKDTMIFRYAWFIARSSPTAETQDVLGQTTGTYTNLGLIYSHMSSYDKNYYHTVNNIIEAEYYIDKSMIYYNCTTPCVPFCANTCWWYSVLLEATSDPSGGVLDAYNFNSANDTIFYNVNIPTTQSYNIDFRVNSTAASTFIVHNAAGTVLGTTGSLNTGGAWSTITLNGVNLTAGKQIIYLTATNGATLELNWLRINCVTGCTLPVEFTSFQAKAISSNLVKLNWQTASEKNNEGFIVERSTDGINFDSVGIVYGKGTTTSINSYLYTDQVFNEELVYYRLKQVDLNGLFSYSTIQSVSFAKNSVRFGQNSIITEMNSGGEIYFSVVSSLGEIIQQGSYYANAGMSEKSLTLNGLAKGVYYIKVVSSDQSYSGKIINP